MDDYFVSKPPANLCSIGANKTQDGHGGRAEEHHREMKEIADGEIQAQVPQMIQ